MIMCEIMLPFMTDHVTVVILVTVCRMPPSGKDRVTKAATAATAATATTTTRIVVNML